MESIHRCTAPHTWEYPALRDTEDEFHSRDARRERESRACSLKHTKPPLISVHTFAKQAYKTHFGACLPTLEPYRPPVTSPFFAQNSQAAEGKPPKQLQPQENNLKCSSYPLIRPLIQYFLTLMLTPCHTHHSRTADLQLRSPQRSEHCCGYITCRISPQLPQRPGRK